MPESVASLRALITRLPVDPDLDQTAVALRRRWTVGLIGLGGATGTLARAGISAGVPVSAHGWPAATLTINVSGSFVLGVLLTVLHERYPHNRWARPLFGTGFCGGYTTFSTFALEFTTRAGDGRAPLAVAYVAVSVLVSLAAALVGVVAVRAAARLSDRHSWRRRIEHAARVSGEDAA